VVKAALFTSNRVSDTNASKSTTKVLRTLSRAKTPLALSYQLKKSNYFV